MYSAICQICGNKFTARAKTTKYCSACVSKAKAEAALHRKEQLNRPLTTDTEFLICLYTYRGDSISRIATDLNRSQEVYSRLIQVTSLIELYLIMIMMIKDG